MANIRRSWLSREILGFNLFAGAATQLLVWGWLTQPQELTGIPLWVPTLATTVFGAIAIGCSAMLYIVTGRPLWTFVRTNGLFFLTAAVLGTTTVAVAIGFLSSDLSLATWIAQGQTFAPQATLDSACRLLAIATIVFVAIKLAFESSIFTHLKSETPTPSKQAAQLMVADLKSVTVARFALAVIGGIVIPLAFLLSGSWILLAAGLVALIAAELTERYLFFAVAVARRMPGAPNQ